MRLVVGNAAEVTRGGSRHTATGDLLSHAETDVRGPIREVAKIESTHDPPIFVDEHMNNAGTGLLFGRSRTMPLSELLTDIIATIAGRLGQVAPIRLLESEDRRFVITANAMQFEHSSDLPT